MHLSFYLNCFLLYSFFPLFFVERPVGVRFIRVLREAPFREGSPVAVGTARAWGSPALPRALDELAGRMVVVVVPVFLVFLDFWEGELCVVILVVRELFFLVC